MWDEDDQDRCALDDQDEPARAELWFALEALLDDLDEDTIGELWPQVVAELSDWGELTPFVVAEIARSRVASRLPDWLDDQARLPDPRWIEWYDAEETPGRDLLALTRAPGGYVLDFRLRADEAAGATTPLAFLLDTHDASRWSGTAQYIPIASVSVLREVAARWDVAPVELATRSTVTIRACRWGVVEGGVSIKPELLCAWLTGAHRDLYELPAPLLAQVEELPAPQSSAALHDLTPTHQREGALFAARLRVAGEVEELAHEWIMPERPAPPAVVSPSPRIATSPGTTPADGASSPRPVRVPFAERAPEAQWGELRSVLQEPPDDAEEGVALWRDLRDMLDDWHSAEELLEKVIPYTAAALERWPGDIIRSADPSWLPRHDRGEPLARALIGLTHAPGGYVLERGLYLAGYDDPNNGAILLDDLGEVEGACYAFIQEAAWSVVGASNALGSSFTLYTCRWGVAVAPGVRVRFTHGDLHPGLGEPEPHRNDGLPEITFAPLPELPEPAGSVEVDDLHDTHTSHFGHGALEIEGEVDELLRF